MMVRERSLRTDGDGRKLAVAGDPTSRVAIAVLVAAMVVAAVLVAKQGALEVSRPPTQPEVAAGPAAARPDPSQPAQAQDDGKSSTYEPTVPLEDVELELWESASASNDPTLLERYLAAYPAGRFVAMARQRLTELRVQKSEPSKTGGLAAPAKSDAPDPAPGIAPPAAARVPAVSDTSGLARALQRELRRVGCLGGEPDGVWGEQSRSALRNFIKEAKLAVEGDEPNAAVLDAATAARNRVCPLVCDEGEHVVNDRCVENAHPPRERAHEVESRYRPTQRERPRRESDEPQRGSRKLCFGPERGGPLVECR